MKKILHKGIVFIALALLLSVLTAGTVAAASKDGADAYLFDANYYLTVNPDLLFSVGADPEALFKHYKSVGIYEGRSASEMFNAMAYKVSNPDIAVLNGMNLLSYSKHYLEQGVLEGRDGNGNAGLVINGRSIAVSFGTDKSPAYLARAYIYDQPGPAFGLGTAIGQTYVEVDLNEQHLYLYENGFITLDTPLVSGNERAGRATPAGVFAIKYKTTDVVLKGEDYAAPVKYWMPFNGGIGLHDADWRKAYGGFGGTIWKTSGSHGCINLPPKAAAIVYLKAYKGMPVICHY